MPQLSTEIPDGKAYMQTAWFIPIFPVTVYCLFAYGYFWAAVSCLSLLALACYKQWQAHVLAQDEEYLWYANRTMPIYLCSEYPGEDIHTMALYCKQMLQETENENKYAVVHEFHFQARPGAARETWSEYEEAAQAFMKELDREAQLFYFEQSGQAYTEFFYNHDKSKIYNENNQPNKDVANCAKSAR